MAETQTIKKSSEFSVITSDNEIAVDVSGMLSLSDKLVVMDNRNKTLKLYDQSNNFLSKTEAVHYPWGITRVQDNTFATCGYGNKVFMWKLSENVIEKVDVSYNIGNEWSEGIHYDGTYYGVLHRRINSITILDKQGRRLKKICIKEAFGKKLEFGWVIHMDSETHNMYIPCTDEDGVLCVSIKGEPLWFTLVPGPRGLCEINDYLYVVDSKNTCVNLISKSDNIIKTILRAEDGGGKNPQYICVGNRVTGLYISYSSEGSKDTVTVFTLSTSS